MNRKLTLNKFWEWIKQEFTPSYIQTHSRIAQDAWMESRKQFKKEILDILNERAGYEACGCGTEKVVIPLLVLTEIKNL